MAVEEILNPAEEEESFSQSSVIKRFWTHCMRQSKDKKEL